MRTKALGQFRALGDRDAIPVGLPCASAEAVAEQLFGRLNAVAELVGLSSKEGNSVTCSTSSVSSSCGRLWPWRHDLFEPTRQRERLVRAKKPACRRKGARDGITEMSDMGDRNGGGGKPTCAAGPNNHRSNQQRKRATPSAAVAATSPR